MRSNSDHTDILRQIAADVVGELTGADIFASALRLNMPRRIEDYISAVLKSAPNDITQPSRNRRAGARTVFAEIRNGDRAERPQNARSHDTRLEERFVASGEQRMYGRTSAPAVTPIAIDLTRSSLIHPITVELAKVFRKLSFFHPQWNLTLRCDEAADERNAPKNHTDNTRQNKCHNRRKHHRHRCRKMRTDPRKNRNEHKHVREISAKASLRERLDGDSIEYT